MVELDPNQRLIADLTPTIETLYMRHLTNAKEWYPHELVPYDLGQSYKRIPWRPEDYPLASGVESAIFTNLLTEDNLSYYYETINEYSPGRDHVWGLWSRRWQTEEKRHATVIREWCHVTRAIDPHWLEKARMAQESLGEVPYPQTAADLFIYTALQELATRVAHGNTSRALDKDRGGKDVMAQVAADEGLHHIFYRDVAAAAFLLYPVIMMKALVRQVKGFDMPGTGIENFDQHTKAIAEAGIYDYWAFRHKVVDPTLDYWGIKTMKDLPEEAELARASLYRHLERRDKVVRGVEAKQQEIAKQLGQGAVLLDSQE